MKVEDVINENLMELENFAYFDDRECLSHVAIKFKDGDFSFFGEDGEEINGMQELSKIEIKNLVNEINKMLSLLNSEIKK